MSAWIQRLIVILIACGVLLQSNFYKSAEYPNQLFPPNHNDEFTYLHQSYLTANSQDNASFYPEHQRTLTFDQNISQNVSSITDYLVGKIGLALNWHPFTLGLLLDLICISFSILLLIKILSLFSSQTIAVYLCALIATIAPWFLSIDSALIFPKELTSGIFNVPTGLYVTPTAIRGVYTQIGLIFFLAATYFAIQALSTKRSAGYAIFAGFTTGLCLYIYFFAWLSAGFLTSLLLASSLLAIGKAKQFTKRLKTFGYYLITVIISSTPGLIMITTGSSLYTVCDPDVSNYWFLSPECLLILGLLITISVVSKHRITKHLNNYPVMISALSILIIAPLIIMNLQPLSSCIISPFRVFYYLLPILTALGLLFLHLLLQTFIPKAFRYLPLACCLPLAILNSIRCMENQYTKISPAEQELISYLQKENLTQKSLAIWPAADYWNSIPQHFPLRPLPSVLIAYQNVKVLSQSWIFPSELSLSEFTEREFYLNWLFRYSEGSAARLLIPCSLLKNRDYLPGDILELTWVSHLLLRERMCSYLEKSPPNICELIKKYQVDFLVWDLSPASPLYLRPYLKLIASAKSSPLYLFKFDKDLALQMECQDSD